MSYAKNLFEGVPAKNVNKSRFNLSHEWKNNVNMGKIIPVLCEPTLPNDEFNVTGMEFMFRFSPLYYPLMHMCNLYCNLFYVPNRILWRETTHAPTVNGWKGFITLGDIDGNTEDHPVVNIDNQLHTTAPAENDTVMGFMGFPYYREAVGWDDVVTNINAFPLSAYLAIWDEYYRNPQLESGKWFNLAPGNNTTDFDNAFSTGGTVTPTGRYRCLASKWEKDYFTSALPQPQIGEPVQIPVIANEADGVGGNPSTWVDANGNPIAGASEGLVTTGGGSGETITATTTTPVGLKMDASIRQLRFAEALQTFKERILKVGQRYTDFLKGLWGNNIKPAELNVPVWFGYYRGKIQISDVTQTAATDTGEAGAISNALGSYAGKADLYERSGDFNVFCSEHGWIIALMELKPNAVYGQGLPRWFRYQLPTDYPLDIFANIGDQEIKKEEIFLWTKSGESAINNDTFGYIPRYSEYRFRNNIYGGNLQTTFGLSQHLGRWWSAGQLEVAGYWDDWVEINTNFINMFDQSFPNLSNAKILGGLREEDVFTVLPQQAGTTPENTIFCHILHSVFVNRELPMFSTPKLG